MLSDVASTVAAVDAPCSRAIDDEAADAAADTDELAAAGDDGF
jgi:hypothetical protein